MKAIDMQGTLRAVVAQCQCKPGRRSLPSKSQAITLSGDATTPLCVQALDTSLPSTPSGCLCRYVFSTNGLGELTESLKKKIQVNSMKPTGNSFLIGSLFFFTESLTPLSTNCKRISLTVRNYHHRAALPPVHSCSLPKLQACLTLPGMSCLCASSRSGKFLNRELGDWIGGLPVMFVRYRSQIYLSS
ncbi:hypothetical protein M0R45_005620 [Rubus argutus]|uniref:Uncharacterized protein n=1 Tax=Rubus argutus TaxID=59490 RepID=A0AAW1YN74_RUBAR